MMTETRAISSTDDLIDTRDIIARIDYLRESWAEATGYDPDDYVLSGDDYRAGLSDDEADELVALVALSDEYADMLPDWQYGETLIRDSYFEQYARDLAEDIGAVPSDYSWPASHIDWEAAAEALLMDYTEVDYDGVTYWARS